jgi:type IV pilus assembly protein PilY1
MPVARSCRAAAPATTDLNTSIAGLTATTWTPLAETLYEVTRYFRGLSSEYNDGVSYTSPIQYRCQKSFVIVITDGYPTQDASFPR